VGQVHYHRLLAVQDGAGSGDGRSGSPGPCGSHT
jgi:hypothetical protein